MLSSCKINDKVTDGKGENEIIDNENEAIEPKTYNVSFDVDGTITIIKVKENEKVNYQAHPEKDGYDFVGWYYNDNLFDFSNEIKEDITIKAKFSKTKVRINYDFGYECFDTKEDLRQSYYTDFYNFLVNKNAKELEEENINNLNDFMKFMLTWQIYDDRSDLYHTGDSFKAYYLSEDIGGKLENQPDTHFIGWCYKNGKYIDFINHLVTFFAYWRTDEGYTSGSGDPNGNDFFAHSWSSLVDTAKFFYFTADTLNIKYPWFDSERVKKALDYIPGVGRVTLEYESDYPIKLPDDIYRDGFIFLGWFDEDGNKVSLVDKSLTVYAKWENSDVLLDLANEFISDFNMISGRNLDYTKFDTRYFNSSEFVDMVNDEVMNKKWMWLYKLLADLSGDETLDPLQDGYSFEDNKGFYIANINALFTHSEHTDTYLSTKSMDFSDINILKQVLEEFSKHINK